MKRLVILCALGAMIAAPALAQSRLPTAKERNVTMQRLAVEAWTACIADEFVEEVHEVLTLDFRTLKYSRKIEKLASERVSDRCFNAMPRDYRRIELSGLPFAGGLAEQAIERTSDEPLLMRLSMAAIGKPAETYSYTDAVANCAVRGAPHLVANLFGTDVASVEETDALEQLEPVFMICTQSGPAIDASPLATRSMLATASYRLLAAQDESGEEQATDASRSEESEDDA
ncbi:hypothetical protein [Qipengyuania nanhaisediminis]|uniref:hypothetical protein n=1 Tax=Qipengyuania nanhaisediminis TaxID=604088 RepID=UPI0038B38905